jgi:hypothetical protein
MTPEKRDTLGNRRATAEDVAALRAGPEWADLRERCAVLPRPIKARAVIMREVQAVFPTLSPLFAGDVAHHALDELVA